MSWSAEAHPLTLSDEVLDSLLASLYAIPHVEMVRIGTKVPMVMPQRITEGLLSVLVVTSRST